MCGERDLLTYMLAIVGEFVEVGTLEEKDSSKEMSRSLDLHFLRRKLTSEHHIDIQRTISQFSDPLAVQITH